MGCEIYLLRKDKSSETPGHGEIVWDVKSSDLAYEFSLHGIGEHYQIVTLEDLLLLSSELINQGNDDMSEYSGGALKALVDYLGDLDLDAKVNSTWCLTMSW